MGTVHAIQNSFAGGEISPHFDARSDLDFYHVACRKLENMTVKPQGGAWGRGGTRFVAEVKASGKRTALRRFEFSTEQAYIIEVGDLYFRFFKDGGRIKNPPGTPVEVATPYALADLFDADGRLRLRFVQSADTLYIAHPLYAPRKLTRASHVSWSLAVVDFVDGPYLDENTSATTLAPAATTGSGVAIAASAAVFAAPDVGRLVRIKHGTTWGYAKIVGYTSPTAVTADVKSDFGGTTAVATWQLGLWSATTGWPAAVTFHEERLFFAGAKIRPQRVDGSRSGDFENFAPGVGDADAVAYSIAANDVNAIRWLASGKALIAGALNAEFVVAGSNVNSPITPTDVRANADDNRGSADMAPVLAGNAVLFVQRHGQTLRELAYDLAADGFKTTNASVRAGHMARSGLIALAYAEEPDGVIWACRADGVLVGFTYLREEKVMAWHRHRLGDAGAAEAVDVIPGDGADEVWLVVRRTIGGVAKRYIERLEPALADDADQVEAFYVDSGLTFDGAKDATLAPGAGATVAGTTGVAFTAAPGVFVSGDVGREIRHRYTVEVEHDDGLDDDVEWREARATITGYVSATVVTATIEGAFPSLETIAAGDWRMSATTISGLDHLEGKTVKVLTDGAVHPDRVVASGALALDYPAAVVHVGLGYRQRLLPMKLDAGARDGTSQGRTKRIGKATARFHRTLGAKIGASLTKLEALPFRDYGGQQDLPPPLFTGDRDVPFAAGSDKAGNVWCVQDEPLPMNVLAIMPRVHTPDGA